MCGEERGLQAKRVRRVAFVPCDPSRFALEGIVSHLAGRHQGYISRLDPPSFLLPACQLLSVRGAHVTGHAEDASRYRSRLRQRCCVLCRSHLLLLDSLRTSLDLSIASYTIFTARIGPDMELEVASYTYCSRSNGAPARCAAVWAAIAQRALEGQHRSIRFPHGSAVFIWPNWSSPQHRLRLRR